jgi:hypothetical protein
MEERWMIQKYIKCSKLSTNLGFLGTDVVKGESTLAVVQQPKVLVCLGNGDHVCSGKQEYRVFRQHNSILEVHTLV